MEWSFSRVLMTPPPLDFTFWFAETDISQMKESDYTRYMSGNAGKVVGCVKRYLHPGEGFFCLVFLLSGRNDKCECPLISEKSSAFFGTA